ncbi:hypothetical protein FK529_06650 [Tsukamurella asaccharolytica]|uniref:Uncharacterized protein n=1 Tax=Tsukamurella asaccharolytica TaxID=2592067 RepID=A0A5C5RCA8_9ACTN|nr:DUF6153 family protein [Tsukamurella asaccharolytica]TWS19825.1 hypothetical protein FK529_06650 [Tsukamurella asaccharolytica]
MQPMRSGWPAISTIVVVAFAVVLMHLGVPPMAMPTAASAPGTTTHHGAPHEATTARPAAAHAAERDASPQKQTVDAVHHHDAHDCAGTVVVHKAVGAPSLVAVLPVPDGAPGATPADRAAVARGPPPWTVLALSQLCLLRV